MRPNNGFNWRIRSWSRIYRNRMNLGLERCRICGITQNLTFDHIVPRATQTRRLVPVRLHAMHNLTILCGGCNVAKGSRSERLCSLAAEEARAVPAQRWSEQPEQWDPRWRPVAEESGDRAECSSRLNLVDDPAAVALLYCDLPPGHELPHWDSAAGDWSHPEDVQAPTTNVQDWT